MSVIYQYDVCAHVILVVVAVAVGVCVCVLVNLLAGMTYSAYCSAD